MADIATLQLKVETGDVKKAATAIELLREQEERLDKESKKLPASQKKVIDQLHRMEAQTRLTTDELELYKLALDGATKEQLENASVMQRQAKASGQAAGGFKLMKGGAANLSMQLQDVAVQAQAGTAATTILAQQGPQIASAFGPAGAAFGAVIAFGSLLAGPLIASMLDVEDEADELEDIMKSLGTTFNRTGAAAFGLSDDLKLLMETNAGLASIELALQMAKAEKAITLAGKAIVSAFGDVTPGIMRGTAEQFLAIGRAAEETDAAFEGMSTRAFTRVQAEAQAVADELGITRDEAGQLLGTFMRYEQDRTPENLSRLQQVVELMATSVALADDEFAALAEVILRAGKDSEAAEALITKLNKALTGQGVATEFADDKAQEYIANLAHEYAALHQTAEQVAYLEAIKAGLSEEEAREAARLSELIRLRNEETAATDAATKAAEAKAEAATKGAEAIALSLMTEEQALTASYEKRRQTILDATFETETERQALLTQLTAAYEKEREELSRNAFEKYLADTQESLAQFDQVLVGMVDQLTTGFGGALESAVFDAESLDEAFAGLAETIGRTAVNALGQFIAQYAVTQLMQKALDKTNQAGAAAMMTGNAAAMAAQAVLNAYASTAAIPIVGPALAPAAAATAAAFAGPLAAAVTAAATGAAAGRALGGQVRPGESYIVGERGPEVLTMGNAGGRIMTNEKLRNQGGAQINYAPTVNIAGGASEQDRIIFAAELKRQKAEIADMLARRRF
jgi:hypothetical protein